MYRTLQMTTVYELTRLHITGPIKPDTPACVILEVAHSLWLDLNWKEIGDLMYIERVVRSIAEYKQPIPSIKEDPPASVSDGATQVSGFKEADVRLLVAFVNPNLDFTWKIKPLLQAFRHLCLFYKVSTPPLPEGEFTVGQKTMSTPLAYNACMLYRLCSYHGIRTTRLTTIEQMAQAARGLTQDPDLLRQQLTVTIRNLPRVALLNLLASPELRVAPSPNLRRPATTPLVCAPALPLPREEHFVEPWGSDKSPERCERSERKLALPSINQDFLTIKALTTAYSHLTDSKHILPRIQPQTQEEAIMLAAVVYGINLTECSNPYEEFAAMKAANLGGASANQYIPTFDEGFQQRYLRNPAWFDVRRTWSARLPGIYTAVHLRDFAQAEGYAPTEFNMRSPEEMMAMSRVLPTFYLGQHPDCDLQHTAIGMVNVTTVHPQLLLTYGISDGGPYTLYTVAELADCFAATRNYSNPEKATELIPTIAIAKLRNIAIHFSGRTRVSARSEVKRGRGETPPVPTEVEVNYLHLLTVMDEVDLYSKANSLVARQLTKHYTEGDEKTRAAIGDVLTSLLHMAYYMRGWKATPDNYDIPISRNKTTFPSAAQGQVYLNAEKAIKDFEASVDQLKPELRTFIRTLPLMNIALESDRVTFQASTSRDQGRTIFERVAIVKAGTSDYSCIRMSSGRFAASACYYMIACKMAPPFNPKLLADVS